MNRLLTKSLQPVGVLLLAAALSGLTAAAARADARFISDHRMTELMLGDKETELTVHPTPGPTRPRRPAACGVFFCPVP